MNEQEFLDLVKRVHDSEYVTSSVDYVDAMTKVTIICQTHGAFSVRPSEFVFKNAGCELCKVGPKRSTRDLTNEFRTVHGMEYTYQWPSGGTSIGNILVKCGKHGAFPATFRRFLTGSGCPECMTFPGKKIRTTHDFIIKSNFKHESSYSYVFTKYSGPGGLITVACLIHGLFIVDPNKHLAGMGCVKCEAAFKDLDKEGFLALVTAWHGEFTDYSDMIFRGMTDISQFTCRKHGRFHQVPMNHIRTGHCSKCNPSHRRSFKGLKVDGGAKWTSAEKFDDPVFPFLLDQDQLPTAGLKSPRLCDIDPSGFLD